MSAKELERIGNVDSLEEILEDIIDEKAKSFIPTAMEELKSILIRSSKIAEHRILQLNRYDREQILEQKKSFLTKINGINADLEEVFGDWCVKIESNKAQAICELRGYYRDYLQLSEKEGVKTHFETRSVSTARWFFIQHCLYQKKNIKYDNRKL